MAINLLTLETEGAMYEWFAVPGTDTEDGQATFMYYRIALNPGKSSALSQVNERCPNCSKHGRRARALIKLSTQYRTRRLRGGCGVTMERQSIRETSIPRSMVGK